MTNDIIDLLYEYEDEKYKDFILKLVPNISADKVIGVRIPKIRLIAKEILKDECKTRDFLSSLPHKYYEENILHSCIISYLKDVDFIFETLDNFLPYIDNWAVCDSLNPKVLKKNDDSLCDLYSKILEWNCSDEEYIVRFVYVCLINNFVKGNFDIAHLGLVVDLCTREVSEKYYVKMAVAWYLSMVLAQHYEDSVFILENYVLPVWIHNKTIQKAVESFRISNDRKEYLKSLRVKNLQEK